MSNLERVAKLLSGKRIIIPIAIGLAVSLYLLLKDFNPQSFSQIKLGWSFYGFLSLAILMVLFRVLGYVIRLRVLSDKQLSWKQSFQLTMLWEFSSAISPGAIGGTAIAFILMAQEKIKTGRSTAIVLVTSFLDVLFYILMVPLIIGFIGITQLFPEQTGIMASKSFLVTYFWIGYAVLFLWTSIIFIGLFIKPTLIKRILIAIFRIRFLKKWRHKSITWGQDLVVASKEFKNKKIDFWLKGFGATFFSWTARFFMVNFIILAFGPLSEHFVVYGRQLVMWVILLVPATPGASGIAEAIFPAFLGGFFSNLDLAQTGALIWRLFSYYPYLIIGVIILPIWLRRVSR